MEGLVHRKILRWNPSEIKSLLAVLVCCTLGFAKQCLQKMERVVVFLRNLQWPWWEFTLSRHDLVGVRIELTNQIAQHQLFAISVVTWTDADKKMSSPRMLLCRRRSTPLPLLDIDKDLEEVLVTGSRSGTG